MQSLLRLLIVSCTFASCAYVVAQETVAPKETGRLLMRVGPSGSRAQGLQTFEVLNKLFEPEQVEVMPDVRLKDLSTQRCGRTDENWIAAVREMNKVVLGTASQSPVTVALPACAFWKPQEVIEASSDHTLSHELEINVGVQGQKTLTAIAKQNQRSLDSLKSLKPGEKLVLPYSSQFVAYTLRPIYRDNPDAVKRQLKKVKGLQLALPEGQLALVPSADDGDCQESLTDPNYPYSVSAVIAVLRFNNLQRTKYGRSLRKAIIGVVDSGLDASETRVFENLNPGELPVPNEIDDDRNGYVDDIWGANMDHQPGLPERIKEFPDGFHGTHVAGLVLGGLTSPELNELVKERIQVKVLNVVSKEVSAGAPPVTKYVIRTGSLMNAFLYAKKYEGGIPILNLSIETGFDDMGIELAMQNTESLAIVAAGNDTQNLDVDEVWPAAMRSGLRTNLISVAAYDQSGALAPFSNWGKSTVDIAAPGCRVDSILPEGERGRVSGTSQAAPLVSFAAGLLYSEGMGVQQIKQRLLLSVVHDHARLSDCAETGTHCVATEGRLNIESALDVYQDRLLYRSESGAIESLTGLITSPCIVLNARCYALSSELMKLEHSDGSLELQGLITSRGGEVRQMVFAGSDMDLNFRATETSNTQALKLNRIIELIPAVWRN